jgi:hypothetical protein
MAKYMGGHFPPRNKGSDGITGKRLVNCARHEGRIL